jgi:hypothetical protein
VIEAIEERDNLYRTYFNSHLPKEERKSGYADVNPYKELEGYDNSKLVLTTTKKSRYFNQRTCNTKIAITSQN